MEIRLEGTGDPWSQGNYLQAMVKRFRDVREERRLLIEVEESLKRTAMTLVRRGYLKRISPDGVPWRPGKSGGGDLIMSGAMFGSLRVEDRPNGFAVVSRVADVDGSYYGGSHQYGRTIRAKGYEPLRAAVRWNGQVVARSAKIRSRSSQPIRAGFGVWAQGRRAPQDARVSRGWEVPPLSHRRDAADALAHARRPVAQRLQDSDPSAPHRPTPRSNACRMDEPLRARRWRNPVQALQPEAVSGDR